MWVRVEARIADHTSSLLLCSSEVSAENLRSERVAGDVVVVGDVMVDVAQMLAPRARALTGVLERVGVPAGEYIVATAHRSGNVDDPARLLEPGEVTVAVCPQRLDRRRVELRAHDDHCSHDFSPLRVGESDHGDIGDGGVLADRALDFGRRDGLPARADDIACASDDRYIALVVDHSEVARVVPAAAEGVGG